jgi:hypothetical protein
LVGELGRVSAAHSNPGAIAASHPATAKDKSFSSMNAVPCAEFATRLPLLQGPSRREAILLIGCRQSAMALAERARPERKCKGRRPCGVAAQSRTNAFLCADWLSSARWTGLLRHLSIRCSGNHLCPGYTFTYPLNSHQPHLFRRLMMKRPAVTFHEQGEHGRRAKFASADLFTDYCVTNVTFSDYRSWACRED